MEEHLHNSLSDDRGAKIPSATEDEFKLSLDRAAQLMKERAFKLSVLNATEQELYDLEVVCFALSDETYAIETSCLTEITTNQMICRVPGTPEFVAGVMNLHGKVLPLIDPKVLLGLSRVCDGSAAAKVMVIGNERAEFGIVVDSIETIRKLERSKLQTPPETNSSNGLEHLLGITLDALIVLNGQAMIEDKRLFVNQTNDRIERLDKIDSPICAGK